MRRPRRHLPLVLLHEHSRIVETAALIAAGLLATVMRFVLFRAWVFRGVRKA